MYFSITKPISYFPTINKSVNIIKDLIKNDHQPFILSASPHFYENAIRDWLYQHEIYTAGIFLKDYRRFFSPFEGNLRAKDLKIHGFYKLHHLINILLMTGIPNRLVLMGDIFESDLSIYLALCALLKQDVEARDLWNSLNRLPSFKFSLKQNSQILDKLYQLETMLGPQHDNIDIKIYIRRKNQSEMTKIDLPILERYMSLTTVYDA